MSRFCRRFAVPSRWSRFWFRVPFRPRTQPTRCSLPAQPAQRAHQHQQQHPQPAYLRPATHGIPNPTTPAGDHANLPLAATPQPRTAPRKSLLNQKLHTGCTRECRFGAAARRKARKQGCRHVGKPVDAA